jgi:phosphoribosyl 1,2-cyclic phosphate phosphodiesterase
MKLTFLGTAAATSYPLAFCMCEYCMEARARGGKNFRKRSSLLINDDLLIDFGPDVLSASFEQNISIANIKFLLQTHSHSDHFDGSHLTTRIPEYMGRNIPELQLFASEATLIRMSEMVANEGYISTLFTHDEQKRLNIEVTKVEKHIPFSVGNYSVVAFSANHDLAVDPLLFSITEGNSTIFYGTDTDVLDEETWKAFHNLKLKFDLIILDHTYGLNADSGGHLNANRFIEHINRMKEEKLTKQNARFFATHLSHEGNPPHEELSEFGKQHGYEIAYDGLILHCP